MSIADFSGRMRPDACPGALQVHEAADGPLARVRLPGGAISPARLRELAACAADLGSDVIELTSRANVQVRGLRSPAAFAERIAAAGLLPSQAHERVRNIVASPLGGRTGPGLLDPQPLVAALDRALCSRPRLAGLPGRFLFAVDEGSGDMLALGADVTFFDGRLLLAGVDAGLAVGADVAAELMIAAAEAFLDERPEGDRGAWRIAELDNGPARIATRLRTTTAPHDRIAPHDHTTTAPRDRTGTADRAAEARSGHQPHAGPAPDAEMWAPPAPVVRDTVSAPRAGRVEQRDGRVALEVVVPLGRLSAAQASAIAAAAEVNGPAGTTGAPGPGGATGVPDPGDATASDPGDATGVPVRLTPWRTVVLLDLPPAAGRAARMLEAAGLVTDPASPWAGVSACTGRPGCAKSLADVQEDARRWVATLDGRPATPVHWAGCERRCGLPRGRVVQMVATGDGYQERHQ
ncbi:precorrin-3B synthase [Nonomuraea sp. NPDC049625]|uniref:precorrin-3B synthase n=1 Tax=Nonomuraea sp. NPDC049625 TaxID=3155775 RepID=UPI00344300ED